MHVLTITRWHPVREVALSKRARTFTNIQDAFEAGNAAMKEPRLDDPAVLSCTISDGKGVVICVGDPKEGWCKSLTL